MSWFGLFKDTLNAKKGEDGGHRPARVDTETNNHYIGEWGSTDPNYKIDGKTANKDRGLLSPPGEPLKETTYKTDKTTIQPKSNLKKRL